MDEDTVSDIVEAAYVDDTPSLWWVLLTRLDGIVLVMVSGFIIFLLLRALFVVQKKLDDANSEIQYLQTNPSRETPAASRPPAQPAVRNQALPDIQGQDTLRIIAEKDAQIRESSDQLNKLYAILADTSEDLTRVPDMQAKLKDEIVLNQQLRAELELKDVTLIELQSSVGDRHELEMIVNDLQDKLNMAEEKIRQNTSVWELMLTQQIASNNSAVGSNVVGAAAAAVVKRSSTPRVRPYQPLPSQEVAHVSHISPSVDRTRRTTPTRRVLTHTPVVDPSSIAASRTTPLRSRTASSQAGKSQEEYLSYLENQIKLLENQGY